jgi:ABC-type amino acid transport substrate-binding protein
MTYMIRLLAVACAALLSVLAAQKAGAQEAFKAVTANLPPYSIKDNLDEPGFSYELLTEMGRRAELKIDMEFLPWRRALAVAKETPNTLLFTVARMPDREREYSWLVDMIEHDVVFVTTKAPIDSVEQAKPLSVSAVPGSPQERELKQANIRYIDALEDPIRAAKMLERGRIDAWYTFDLRAAYVWKKNGFPAASLVFGKSLRIERMYLAGHKDMSPVIKDRLQAAYDSLVRDGTYKNLFHKYFGDVRGPD